MNGLKFSMWMKMHPVHNPKLVEVYDGDFYLVPVKLRVQEIPFYNKQKHELDFTFSVLGHNEAF